jgi:uncharacterized SAM-binding protein YcdF (DUF218 family)
MEHRWLLRLYDSLTIRDPVQPADLIFVLAGRMERKQYGLELYRAGVAPRLILSVGRFEVSKMRNLEVDGFDDLRMLRDRIAPDERHFFITIDSSGTRIEKIRLPRWSTYGEAIGLRQFLKSEKAQRIILVSTDVHLYRVSIAFSRAFRHIPVEFFYVPVPWRPGLVRREGWWRRREDRRFVLTEMIKLIGYKLILSMPPWAERRLMRLKS